MSIRINLKRLSAEQIDQINTELVVVEEANKYNKFAKPKHIYAFHLNTDNTVSIPFAYAIDALELKRRRREEFSQRIVSFAAEIREQQKEVYDESLKSLSSKGYTLLSLPTGFGKTFLSLKLSTVTKMKTLIIVNKIVLMNQWEESIVKFCPKAKVQLLKNKEVDPDVDFYIINAINIPKRSFADLKDIGTLIVDECHLIMAEMLSKCMIYLSPRYLIGLSATPYRTDGMDALIGFYFGQDKIIKTLKREHIVYKIETGFQPLYTLTTDGKVNWGSLLDSQCNDTERNELIISIVQKFKDRNILVLSKRVEQCNYLFQRLVDEKENVTSLIGKEQEFDRSARILIGTTSKCSTGFDFAKLDTLILACDVKDYFVQVLGRVLRRPEVKPIIFDLVDDNPILKIHFFDRLKVYKEIGGRIIKYDV